jgi:hypothetical protein
MLQKAKAIKPWYIYHIRHAAASSQNCQQAAAVRNSEMPAAALIFSTAGG